MAREVLAILGELIRSRSLLYVALFTLPYAGVLIGLDVAGHYGALTNADLPVQFNLASDGGFGEWDEYAMTASVAAMLFLLWWRDRDWAYLTNAILFVWLTIDNSMQFHEVFGQWLAPVIAPWNPLPMEANHLGEPVLLLTVGLVWATGLVLSLRHGQFRPVVYSLLLAGCIGMTAVFGVIVDLMTSWGGQTPLHLEVTTFVEDGGEFVMIIISFLLTVAIFDTERRKRAASAET